EKLTQEEIQQQQAMATKRNSSNSESEFEPSEDNALNHVSKQQPEEVSPTSDIAKDDVEVASTTNETNGYLKTNEISNDSDIDVN
ncbi:serine protease, partial [Staphylococcus epidermidis]